MYLYIYYCNWIVGAFTSSRLAIKVENHRSKLIKFIDNFQKDFDELVTFEELEAKLEKSSITELHNSVQFWKLIEQALILKQTIDNSLILKDEKVNILESYDSIKLSRCKELENIKKLKRLINLKKITLEIPNFCNNLKYKLFNKWWFAYLNLVYANKSRILFEIISL